jgi:hypothetical protein
LRYILNWWSPKGTRSSPYESKLTIKIRGTVNVSSTVKVLGKYFIEHEKRELMLKMANFNCTPESVSRSHLAILKRRFHRGKVTISLECNFTMYIMNIYSHSVLVLSSYESKLAIKFLAPWMISSTVKGLGKYFIGHEKRELMLKKWRISIVLGSLCLKVTFSDTKKEISPRKSQFHWNAILPSTWWIFIPILWICTRWNILASHLTT